MKDNSVKARRERGEIPDYNAEPLTDEEIEAMPEENRENAYRLRRMQLEYRAKVLAEEAEEAARKADLDRERRHQWAGRAPWE